MHTSYNTSFYVMQHFNNNNKSIFICLNVIQQDHSWCTHTHLWIKYQKIWVKYTIKKSLYNYSFLCFFFSGWCLLISQYEKNFFVTLGPPPLPGELYILIVYVVLDCKVLWANALGKTLQKCTIKNRRSNCSAMMTD